MNINSLKPAGSLSASYGVKSIVYGAPGSGKTPLIGTCPRPVLLATEPGLLSMRGSNVPTFEAHNSALIKEFFDWFFGSKETANFDTLAIDSLSQLSEIYLADELAKVKHGLKAYGNMSERVMDLCNRLFYTRQKHIVMLAKQGIFENGRQTIIQSGEVVFEPVMQKRPFFPGRDLHTKLPHLFDNVFHLGEAVIPGMQKPQAALRTREIPEIFARSRIGTLGELEPPHLGEIFNKVLG